jgi:hypothetical protein
MKNFGIRAAKLDRATLGGVLVGRQKAWITTDEFFPAPSCLA